MMKRGALPSFANIQGDCRLPTYAVTLINIQQHLLQDTVGRKALSMSGFLCVESTTVVELLREIGTSSRKILVYLNPSAGIVYSTTPKPPEHNSQIFKVHFRGKLKIPSGD